ncbi:YoaK family protein [Cupriavidus sp. WKF15]|uniref:YoaK family protein n=1 Tax=Cupriavidus sp. WKF15 TaxID=3032282 RepID=UPI0023E34AA8|nr:YoaK family protein [Cupriavidus sp. WKF15]WER49135.1 YoaK family protein [Cupriavidus sp. WKF15]
MSTVQPPASAAASPGPATGCILAFVAGFVDVVGFISLFGLFTAHVTGNFIMIGVDVTGNAPGLLSKLLALPAFVLAVAATRLAEVRIARTGRSPVAPLLLTEAALLALFMAASLHAAPVTDPSAPAAIVAGMLAVVAMGLQNAMSRTSLSELGPTTIMTGNTTQIVIDLVDLPSASGTQRDAIRRRLRKMGPALAAFALGAILGALGYAWLSVWCVLLPTVLLVTVGIPAWRRGQASAAG